MFTFEDILSASSGPVILSENHDLGSIAVEIDFDRNAQSRINAIAPGGWDAAEYGISREQAIAMVEAENTPEARERAINSLRERAIRRAALDTSNGRVNVMVAGQAPWHRLGVNVRDAVSSADAIKLSGLDWRVGKLPLSYEFAGERMYSVDSHALVRSDTGAHLGTVGNRYQPIQNAEGFAFLDSVLGEFGARYETAGSLYGGKQVWMLVHLPRQAFSVGAAADKIEPYALFSNPHDGVSGCAACYPTAERVVCGNTLRVSTKDAGKGIRIRHTGNVRAKIADAQNALSLAVQGFDTFHAAADAMARKPLEIKSYVSAVLDATLEYTALDVRRGADAIAREILGVNAEQDAIERERKSVAKKLARRESMFADILERYESERSPSRGTAWAALNAVTEFADHGMDKLGRQVGSAAERADRRMDSVIAGDADEMKQAAYRLAMA